MTRGDEMKQNEITAEDEGQQEAIYACIDLKSFYASVECVERRLDPMTAYLAVADPERTDKTICLAVSPAMKKKGVKNRCRVFEIPKDVDFIMAPPRMQLYIDYSARIYGIYLKYIAREDIHVYSIDEVFLSLGDYLELYQMSARELTKAIMEDIYKETGIPAACGIGTNLYLAKVALDITAKHTKDRIGELTEESYRNTLWNHQPITDFWRIGEGIARRLAAMGITTMGDLARADEQYLYQIFGVDAELLIDHAWGKETVRMEDIKAYRPETNCMSSGQVFPEDYEPEKGKLAVKEMADLLCLDLVEKGLVTESVTLYVRYSRKHNRKYDRGTVKLPEPTSSSRIIISHTAQLYDRILEPGIPIRRVILSFNRLVKEGCYQYSLFYDTKEMERERRLQEAMLSIKKRFGKNAVLKGMNLEEGATTIQRNQQIGGHRSGI